MKDEKNVIKDDDLDEVSGGYAGPKPDCCKFCGDTRLIKVKRFNPITAELETEWWECKFCGRRQDW